MAGLGVLMFVGFVAATAIVRVSKLNDRADAEAKARLEAERDLREWLERYDNAST